MEWKSRGWSASIYTPSRFEAVIAAGSLFVQHLKHEGIIIEDNEDWLRSKLSAAKPHANYMEHAKKSVSLVLPLERFSNDDKVFDFPIAGDIAFVGFRNYAINLLASHGEFVFGFDELVEKTKGYLNFSSDEVSFFRDLRSVKADFRHSAFPSSATGTIGELKNALNCIFSDRPIGTIEPYSPSRELGSGYANLRDLEALVVACLRRYPSESEVRSLKIEDVWKCITRPQDYAWLVRTFEQDKFLDGSLDERIQALRDKISPEILKKIKRMSPGQSAGF